MGKVDKCKTVIVEYLNQNPEDTIAKNILKSCNIYDDLQINREGFIIKTPSFSTKESHFSPIYYNDKIIFTAAHSTKTDPWTGRPFTSLLITDENLANPTLLKGNINGKYHNGAACTMGDNTIYFTRNSRNKSKKNELNLIIAQAELKNDKWKFEAFFPYNSKEYNTAYPTVDDDGKTMIFSSDRPGGLGGMDLYISKYQNGKWTIPKNLGPPINTSQDETFPNFARDNKLYFSSTGHPGLGGADIFETSLENNMWTNPINTGAPINSSYDDFGLITKDNGQTGYFSSNRNNVDGRDEIIQFIRKKRKMILHGIVVDKYTGIPLADVKVKLENLSTGSTEVYMTKANGRFQFSVIEENQYIVEGLKNNILTTKEVVRTSSSSANLNIKLLHNDPRFTLNGITTKLKDKKPVSGVSVILYNRNKNSELTTISDENGRFPFSIRSKY